MQLDLANIHRIATSEPLRVLKKHLAVLRSRYDVGALLISGVIAQQEGQPTKAIRILRQAIAAANSDERDAIADVIVPILLMVGRIGDAASYCIQNVTSSRVAPALIAMRSLIEAMTGDTAVSQESSHEAVRALDDETDELIAARTLHRLACAAYYRGDWTAALDFARASVLKVSDLDASRPLAAVYSLIYNLHHVFTGDHHEASAYARLMTDAARSAGDASFEFSGQVAQYELAAEAADEDEVRSLVQTLRRARMPQQYGERFALVLGDCIVSSWSRDFNALANNARQLRESAAKTETEVALALALKAAAAAGQLDFADASRSARAAIAIGAMPRGAEPAFQVRYRRLARAIAGAVCMIIGDRVRGARAVSPKMISRDPAVAAIIGCALGAPWQQSLVSARGYARMISATLAAVTESSSQHDLTKSEVLVLQLLADGMSAPAIALATNRSVHTIRTHTRAIIQKLHVQGRSAAVAAARRSGII